MALKDAQRMAWATARRQHWVVTRHQLLALGFRSREIDLRLESGRLHRVHAGVYAVGRPSLTRAGHFMAAVLACGPFAVLSHVSAAQLWAILSPLLGPLHVTVPSGTHPRRHGIVVHRRADVQARHRLGIPVTTPGDTIVDIAPDLTEPQLERAINEAANRDLLDTEGLRRAVATMRNRPGVRKVAQLLDRDTYTVTDSRLEQRLLRIAHAAGLRRARAQARREGGRVDLFWPDLGLVVEADSLRFHRTPAQQRVDRLRDSDTRRRASRPSASRTGRSSARRITWRRPWRPSRGGWPPRLPRASPQAPASLVRRQPLWRKTWTAP
jgi:predicted transcriptional regulator of viral defense system